MRSIVCPRVAKRPLADERLSHKPKELRIRAKHDAEGVVHTRRRRCSSRPRDADARRPRA